MPLWAADQDALNALLTSEIPAGAVELLPATHEVHPVDLMKTRIVDLNTLECALNGERARILQLFDGTQGVGPERLASGPPRRVREVVRSDRDWKGRVPVSGAGGAALVAALTGRPGLRPSPTGKFGLAAVDIGNGIVGGIRRRLPERASAQLLRAKARLTGIRKT
jgi:hypothetical protein